MLPYLNMIASMRHSTLVATALQNGGPMLDSAKNLFCGSSLLFLMKIEAKDKHTDTDLE